MEASDRQPATKVCRVAVVQHAPVFLNLDACLDKACGLVEEAAGEGAQVVVFPETWLPGYPVWIDNAPGAALWDAAPAKQLFRLLAENAVTVPGRHVTELEAIARERGVYLVMGVHERCGGTLYNTMISIDGKRQETQIHRKLVPTYTERLVWGRGDGSTLGVMRAEFGSIGGLICWEHWMPLARAAMHSLREDIHVAQWPAVRDLHQIASRHYAFEGQCFVLAAGSILSRGQMLDGARSLGPGGAEAVSLLESVPGDASMLLLNGGSAVIGPDARYVEGPVFDVECILYADLDLGRTTEGLMYLDTAGHYSRPDVFRLEVDIRPQTGVRFSSGDERDGLKAGGSGHQAGPA